MWGGGGEGRESVLTCVDKEGQGDKSSMIYDRELFQ